MQTRVLTIKEVADYLRLPEEVVLNEAAQGHLPGRKIADTWRFLKDAIDDWLRTQDSRTTLEFLEGEKLTDVAALDDK